MVETRETKTVSPGPSEMTCVGACDGLVDDRCMNLHLSLRPGAFKPVSRNVHREVFGVRAVK